MRVIVRRQGCNVQTTAGIVAEIYQMNVRKIFGRSVGTRHSILISLSYLKDVGRKKTRGRPSEQEDDENVDALRLEEFNLVNNVPSVAPTAGSLPGTEWVSTPSTSGRLRI
jgi:hypothetical protein